MSKLKRNHEQSLNKTKKIPMHYQKNNSASLTLLITTGAYKKRIKDLMKNNKNLASELQRSRSQVSAQLDILKDYVRDSNHIMYARAKLKDMASYVHKLAIDYDAVMDFLEVNSHLKNLKYNTFYGNGSHHQNMRMEIKNPTVSCIEESMSIDEDTFTTAASNTVANKASKSDLFLLSRMEECEDNCVPNQENIEKSIQKNNCNEAIIIKEDIMDDVQTIEQTFIDGSFNTKGSKMREAHKSTMKPKHSVRKNCDDEHEAVMSPVSLSPKVRKQNVLKNKVLSSEDKLLTPKLILLETDMQNIPKVKTTKNEKPYDSYSLKPSKYQQTDVEKTNLICSNHERNKEKDISCTDAESNQGSKWDSDTSKLPSSNYSPKIFSGKSKQGVVIHKQKSSCTSYKNNRSICSKQYVGKSFKSNTEMKAVGNFQSENNLLFTDTKLNSGESFLHKPDYDIYNLDASNEIMKPVSTAEKLNTDTLFIKSPVPMSDKILEKKRFFPSKQNCKKDSMKASSNIVDSVPSFNLKGLCSIKTLGKCNSIEKEMDADEVTNLSSTSDSSNSLKKEKNLSEQKKVCFAKYDSVYKLQKNSAVISSSKKSTMQLNKNDDLGNFQDSDLLKSINIKEVTTEDKKEECLELTEKVIKEDTLMKKKPNECQNHHEIPSKQIDQCTTKRTLKEVSCPGPRDRMVFDNETEVFTFAPSKEREIQKHDPSLYDFSMITIQRSENYYELTDSNFDVSNTDLQASCMKTENKIILKDNNFELKSSSNESKNKSGVIKIKKDLIPVPESSCQNTFDQKENLSKESKIPEKSKNKHIHSEEFLKISAAKSSPKYCLRNNRPKRECKPVCYKEPNLSKKMRREM